MLAVGVLLASCTKETTPEPGNSASEFEIEYEKYTLDNGLDVILHVDRSDPVVAVASIFHVGSSREGDRSNRFRALLRAHVVQ